MTAAVVPIRAQQDALADILQLIDLEDQGEAQAQAHSMRAAKALVDLYDDKARWVPEMERLKTDTEAHTGIAVQWSPSSERSFNKWLLAKLEEADHRRIELRTMKRLMYAENMRRLMPRGINSPKTEKAWRPAIKLYTSGYHQQLVDAVRLAADIAEREGLDGISQGVMSTATAQIWKSDREIQAKGAHPDQATDRDRAIRARNEAERWIKELWKTEDDEQIDGFRRWIAEWVKA